MQFKYLCRPIYGVLYSFIHLYGSVFSFLLIKRCKANVAEYFPHSLPWFNMLQHLPNGFTVRFLQHLFSQFSSFWTVSQWPSWNWLFFHLQPTFPSTQKGSQLACTSQLRQPIIFCLSHLPHPLFSSELRSHLSMLWVPARKNRCTECHALSV